MPSRIKILCNAASNGAVALVNKLRENGIRTLKVRNINPRNRALIVAWGVKDQRANLNKPEAIAVAQDKLRTFQALKAAGVSIPLFTAVKAEVNRQRGDIWLARTRGGTGGQGITVVRDGDLPDAQLYVKYVPKSREFRLHMFKNKQGQANCIHLQEKKRKTNNEQTNDQKLIRNHNNGWVFCEKDLDVSATLKATLTSECTKAINALGLDFGAFDVILSKDGRNVYILEANTRPGIESTATATAYATALTAYVS